MSGFNGSGTFNISGIGLPYTSGTTISSSVANTLNTQIANGLSTCILKDGTQTITANIPFNGNKITGLGTGTATSDAASVYNLQLSTGTVISASGTNALTASAAPPLTSGYVSGMTFRFFAPANNTAAVTINIDGQGVKSITRDGSSALASGEISSGNLITITYNGTAFVLQNAVGYDTSGNVTLATSDLTLTAGDLLVDAGNVGIGVTPSAWNSDRRSIDLYTNGYVNAPTVMNVGLNFYWNGSNFIYKSNGFASGYQQNAGNHVWNIAPSGTAGNTISFTQAMTLDASGNLGLGVTPSSWNIIKSMQVGNGAGFSGSIFGGVPDAYMTSNCYYDGTDWRYISNNYAMTFDLQTNQYGTLGAIWNIASLGTAGNAITFTQAMTLNASGNLGIGTVIPAKRLDVLATSDMQARLNTPAGNRYTTLYLANNSSNMAGFGYDVTANEVTVGGLNSGSNLRLMINTGQTGANIASSGMFQFNSGYGSVATAYGCRAWVNFDGTTATPSTIRASGNVSSITRTSTGQYTINFAAAMPDANYVVNATGNNQVFNTGWTANSTSAAYLWVYNSGGSAANASFICVSIIR